MITKEQQRDLGFKTLQRNKILRWIKNIDIPKKHSVLKIDNGMTLLIRGHRIFYIDDYSWIMDCYNHGDKQQFFAILWKKPSLDISKVSYNDIARIVNRAKGKEEGFPVIGSYSSVTETMVIDLRGSLLTEEMLRKGAEVDGLGKDTSNPSSVTV